MLYICNMKTKQTYEELVAENTMLKHRIAYLERMLYGSKSDRIKKEAVTDGQPGLFDDFFKEAIDEKTAEIEKVAKEIEATAEKRRKAASKKTERPAKYQYAGLEERTTLLMPEGVDADMCDVIGKDVTRILHREPAKVWVEVIERPILRLKADKQLPNPRIYQAKAPSAVIGGNHIGSDILAQIVIDKYRYHLPEYRQVKQYADLGVKLPTSISMTGYIGWRKNWNHYMKHCAKIFSQVTTCRLTRCRGVSQTGRTKAEKATPGNFSTAVRKATDYIFSISTVQGPERFLERNCETFTVQYRLTDMPCMTFSKNRTM